MKKSTITQLEKLAVLSPQEALKMIEGQLASEPDNHNLHHLKKNILESLGDMDGSKVAQQACLNAFQGSKEAPVDNLPSFHTDRLQVYEFDVLPGNLEHPRKVYFGFLVDEEVPYPICTLTAWINCPYIGNFIEMLHTHEAFRRKGLATELKNGVEKQLNSKF